MKTLLSKITLALVALVVSGCQTTPPAPTVGDYWHAGLSHEKEGNIPAAIADYTQVLELAPRFAPALSARGYLRYKTDALDAAIGDFSEAIRDAPRVPIEYRERGAAYEAKGDLESALDDYTIAIQLDPNDSFGYFERGDVRRDMGDLDGAIADFTRAIERDPHDVLGYWGRGHAKTDKSDYAGAMADYTSAIELDRSDAESFRARADFQFVAGRFAGALEDFEQVIRLSKEKKLYPYFHIHLLRLRLGLPVDRGSLIEAVKRWTKGWPQPVGRYFSGEITEAELLKFAEQGDAKTVKDHCTDAYYYSGALHLVSGDVEGARALFLKCVDNGLKHSVEYVFATAELRRLGPEKSLDQGQPSPPSSEGASYAMEVRHSGLSGLER